MLVIERARTRDRGEMIEIFKQSFFGKSEERNEADLDYFTDLFETEGEHGYVARDSGVEGLGFLSVGDYKGVNLPELVQSSCEVWDIARDMKEKGEHKRVEIPRIYDLQEGALFFPEESNRIAYLHTLAVHPDFRRRKIGTDLVSGRIEQAKMLGANYAITGCDASSGSVKIYDRMGFTPLVKVRNGTKQFMYRIKQFTK